MPNEIPGWPILKAKSGPNGPRICIVAANPVVIVAWVAFRAASIVRLGLGANSLARNARNFSRAWDSELINGEFLLAASNRRHVAHRWAVQPYSPRIVTTAVCPIRYGWSLSLRLRT